MHKPDRNHTFICLHTHRYIIDGYLLKFACLPFKGEKKIKKKRRKTLHLDPILLHEYIIYQLTFYNLAKFILICNRNQNANKWLVQ